MFEIFCGLILWLLIELFLIILLLTDIQKSCKEKPPICGYGYGSHSISKVCRESTNDKPNFYQ